MGVGGGAVGDRGNGCGGEVPTTSSTVSIETARNCLIVLGL